MNNNNTTDVAVSKAHNIRITNEEWFEISNALEPHHAVFYQVWQMGKPIFDESISTACVNFDEEGRFVLFKFNPLFWKSLDFKNKLFVICHESLHIVLNHGLRARQAMGSVNGMAANMAMDIVVNHTLVRNFGFNRQDITNAEEYCWVDTVFKNRDVIPNDNEMFEYYMNLFEKVYGDGAMGDGSNTPSTVDDHEGLASGKWEKMIDYLDEKMNDEEKESLKSTIKKHFQKNEENKEEKDSGQGTGGQWVFSNGPKPVKKRKWESIIKKWVLRHISESDKDIEQWARMNRRMIMLPRTMILPSEIENDDYYDQESKINVWFFLDTSGSCWDLKDRFFSAAESIPEKRFKVRLFCFDTKVEETTLESRKIYGGGGTSFRIIEQYIQNIIKKENNKYPQAIFIISDGYGDIVYPAEPAKWHWFLTAGGIKSFIHKDCNIYNLEDYE